MSKRTAVKSTVATMVAACAFYWLVATINAHGDAVQQDVAAVLEHPRVGFASEAPALSNIDQDSSSLDMIDMYECMCGPVVDDIRTWSPRCISPASA